MLEGVLDDRGIDVAADEVDQANQRCLRGRETAAADDFGLGEVATLEKLEAEVATALHLLAAADALRQQLDRQLAQ